MAPFLVVSDPPHGSTDLVRSAECLGVSQAEARMKAGFRAPEIWQAHAEEEAATIAADELREAGLRTAVLNGADLANVPAQRPALRFSFGERALSVTLRDGTQELAYDADTLGVFCKTPPDYESGGGRHRRSLEPHLRPTMGAKLARAAGVGREASFADTFERSVFLDLYVTSNGAPTRVTIAQDLADFSGLKQAMRPGAAENMAICMKECERRFSSFRLDRRLEGVLPRRRLKAGATPFTGRKLLSFGTPALGELLESISPGLGDITQFDLGSRMSYLIARSGARPDLAVAEREVDVVDR